MKLLLGLSIIAMCAACLCHLPRGPDRCAGAPTKACAGGGSVFVYEEESDAGSK